ncbi:MAG: glycine cleavage system protein GcvH [Hyphomicrobiales bacterium]
MGTKYYTTDHEWIDVDGDVVTFGITDHAQSQLGDIVFVELPAVGRTVTKGDAAAVVESVKAASDVYAPVSGEVIAVNSALEGDPATVNKDAGGNGWFGKIRLSNPKDVEGLMSETEYEAYLAQGD